MDFNHWLQSRLTAHGYAVGAIDGVIDGTTVAALKAFQSSRRLPMSGQGDAATVAALRLQASAVTPAEQAVIGNIDTPALIETLPNIVQPIWPRQNDVAAYFGKVGENQIGVEPPFALYLAWAPSTLVRRITVHFKVAEAVGRALGAIGNAYSAKEREQLGLDKFGGSLNVRRMRGGSRYSMHSWGIALDFDPQRNGLTTRAPDARLSHDDAKAFWSAWKAEGALPLGEAIGRDWMHVQFARL